MKEKPKGIFLGWGYEGKELYPPNQIPKQMIIDHILKPINKVMGLNLKINAG
jgi:hypothetical protein